MMTEPEERQLLDAIEKEKKNKTPCEWCDREIMTREELHKLNKDRICDKHANDIIEALANDWGLWI